MPSQPAFSPGDPLGPETLQRYEPFVRRILRRMLQGEEEVNDLVQETWLRVLQSPPQDPQQARGWLATVARNLARDFHRRQSNRLAREALAARDETDSEWEASGARLELHQRIVQEVIDLPEPYKPVVILHYFEGLQLQSIAERLQRAEGTVRSQLHRAHALLKERLDQRYGQRQAWVLVGIPWVIQREGPRAFAPSALSAGTWVPWIAALWLSLGGLGGWWTLRAAPDATETPVVESAPFSNFAPLDGARMEDPAPALRQSDQASNVDSATASVPLQPIEVEVQHLGHPLPGVEVWAWRPMLRNEQGFASGAAWQDLNLLRQWPGSLWTWTRSQADGVRSDDRGRVRLHAHPEGVVLFAQAPGFAGMLRLLPLPAPDPAGAPIRFPVPVDHGVRVRLVDALGLPAPDMPVELWSETAEGTQRLVQVLHTQGPFAETHFVGFRAVQPGVASFIVRVGCLGVDSPHVPVPPPGDPQTLVLEVPPCGSLTWSVPEQVGGDPGEPRSLWLQALDAEGRPAGDPIWRPARGRRGRWACVALGRSWHVRLESVGSGELCEWQGLGPDVEDPHRHADLRPVAVCRVEGRLHSTTAVPLRRFAFDFDLLDEDQRTLQTVRFLPQADGTFSLALPLLERHANGMRAEIVGRWKVDPQHRIRVQLPARPWNVPGTLRLGAVPATLVPAGIHGRVLDANGEAVAGLQVAAASDRAGEKLRSVTDAEGRFALDGLLPTSVVVEVPLGQTWYSPPTPWPLSSQEEGHLVVARTGQLTGTWQGAQALPPNLSLYADSSNEPAPLDVDWDAQKGTFVVRGVPAGLWRLQTLGAEPVPARRIQVFPGVTSEAGHWPPR